MQTKVAWLLAIGLLPPLAAAATPSATLPLGVPKFASVNGDGTTVGLSWWATPGASGGYMLLRASDPQSKPTTVATVSAGTTGARDAQPGATGMYYQLVALGANGAQSSSPWILVNTPTVTAVAPSGSDVIIRWSTVAAAPAGCEIWRAADPARPAVRVGSVAAGITSFTDKGAAATSYYYQVVALGGGARAASAWSMSGAAGSAAAPPGPQGLPGVVGAAGSQGPLGPPLPPQPNTSLLPGAKGASTPATTPAQDAFYQIVRAKADGMLAAFAAIFAEIVQAVMQVVGAIWSSGGDVNEGDISAIVADVGAATYTVSSIASVTPVLGNSDLVFLQAFPIQMATLQAQNQASGSITPTHLTAQQIDVLIQQVDVGCGNNRRLADDLKGLLRRLPKS